MSNDYRDQISSSSEEEDEDQNRLLLRKKSVEELFEGYTYYAKEPPVHKEPKEKHRKDSTNIATTSNTANTHYSYLEEKDSHRAKPKTNNFLKY